jgi:hypothetical protein
MKNKIDDAITRPIVHTMEVQKYSPIVYTIEVQIDPIDDNDPLQIIKLKE